MSLSLRMAISSRLYQYSIDHSYNFERKTNKIKWIIHYPFLTFCLFTFFLYQDKLSGILSKVSHFLLMFLLHLFLIKMKSQRIVLSCLKFDNYSFFLPFFFIGLILDFILFLVMFECSYAVTNFSVGVKKKTSSLTNIILSLINLRMKIQD